MNVRKERAGDYDRWRYWTKVDASRQSQDRSEAIDRVQLIES